MNRTLTVEQAALKLQVKPNTVRRWIKHGRIPGCKIGRIFRISEEDLERVLAGEKISKPPAVSQEERAAIVREIRGKYRGMLSSVDDFLRQKHEENEAEERGR
ncbi:MAG TPA: helix-turn-helix domain-containing protein [Armatimonadota bacterium]|nr:helix-turn-helix domain-containing protein [Armatimonadota bacterium]